MEFKTWKKEILTIPNLLSITRLLLIPVYTFLYNRAEVPRDYRAAGLVLAISCLTDLLDGWIARRFHMKSALGKVLDPMADKATQFTLTVCLSLKYPVLRRILPFFLIKEGFQIIAGILFLKKGKILTGALFIGKLCTAVYFSSLVAMVALPDMSDHTVSVIAALDCLLLAAAFAGYLLAYAGKAGNLENIETNE